MTRRILSITSSFVVSALVLSLVIAFPRPAFAQAAAWSGPCVDKVDTDVATLQGAECLVRNMLNIGVSLVGLAAFIMFIVGAFLYLTSGGNPKGTEAGQKTITFAVIGVVVSLTGFVVLNFLSSFTGVESIQNFTLDVGKLKN